MQDFINISISIYNWLTYGFPYLFFPFGETYYLNIMSNQLTHVPYYIIAYFVLCRIVLHALAGILIIYLLHLLYKKHRLLELTSLVFIETYILFQEIYLHPHMLAQPIEKSILDIIVWNIPIFLHLHLKHFIKRRSYGRM